MKAGGGGGRAAFGSGVGHGVGHGGGHGAAATGVAQQAGRYDEEWWQQPARAATVNATNNV
jgi:hypothetical protein